MTDKKTQTNQTNPKFRIQDAKKTPKVLGEALGVCGLLVILCLPCISCASQHAVDVLAKIQVLVQQVFSSKQPNSSLILPALVTSEEKEGERHNGRGLCTRLSPTSLPHRCLTLTSALVGTANSKKGRRREKKAGFNLSINSPYKPFLSTSSRDCLSLPKAHFWWSWG